jgi:hypothetical protein
LNLPTPYLLYSLTLKLFNPLILKLP